MIKRLIEKLKTLHLYFVSCRFVIKDKFTNNYYEYTNNGQQIWTGKIETSKHFKYKIAAYVYSLFIDRNNTTVVKTYN